MRSRGFTLIELVAVMTLVAILSVAATPVLYTVQRSRETGLLREIDRRLTVARADAMATGLPSGLRVDVAAQSLSLLQISASGAAPTPLAMPSAESASSGSIAAMFPGAIVTAIDFDDAGAYDTLWFDREGTPHLRTAAGAYAGPIDRDATLAVTGGGVLTVRRLTGMVER